MARRVVLWTRVRWEVSRDERFRKTACSGTFTTNAARDHTVKVDATGLAPQTSYYYRFTVGSATSPVGRTRTAPDEGSSPDNLRLGVVSCANLQAGWFSAAGTRSTSRTATCRRCTPATRSS